MKRSYFIVTFIATHIFFIFFQIHKHSKIIRFSYQKQKNEQKKELLIQKIQELTQNLYELKKRSSIKKYAQKKLKMRKIKLSQIKKITPKTQPISSQ